MARAFTAAERTNIGATAKKIYARLFVRDSEGNWKDTTTDFASSDYFLGATLEKGLEDNSWRLTARFRLDNGSTASLAPLREDSTINVDSGMAYAPMFDAQRQWKCEVAVIEASDTLQSSDWKEICAGIYDIIDISGDPRVLTIYGRDWGASLLNAYIHTERTYGSDDSPVPMEDVIQQVLNDNGLDGITLYTPASPSFTMESFTLKDLSVMQAVNLIASKAAFKVYYEYDASDVFRLTLKAPNRAAVAADKAWTLGPGEYYEVPVARLHGDQIRNEVIGRYFDIAADEVKTIPRKNTTSIARYGGPEGISFAMALDLSKDTNLTTSARVTTLLDAVLSDVATPPFEHEYVTPGFWIAQLGDYGEFTANGVHYSTTQYGGVNYIKHQIANGTIKTHIKVGGQPAGRYRTWLADPRLIKGVPELKIKNFRETARTTSAVTYGFAVEGEADQLWLWYDTSLQPIGSDPWQDLNTAPDKKYTKDTRSFSIDIPAVGYTTYGQLVPISANAVRGKPWRFTLQGEQIKLIQSAAISSPTATQCAVTVKVANPIAGGNVTVTPEAVGCTLNTGAQTIASGSVTDSLATTGSVSWTATRAAFGSGVGRIVFTATATDRIADVDAVDIAAVDTVELLMRSTIPVTTNATTMVVRVAVADPVSGPGTGDISIAYTATSGTSVSPASPQTIASASVTTSIATTGTVDFTITRPSYLSGTGLVTFTATRTGRVGATLAVEVPAQEGDVLTDPENMVANGGGHVGLADGTLASGWTNRGGNNVTNSTNAAKFGTRSLLIDNSGGAADSFNSQDFSVVDGGVYELSGWIKTDSINGGTGNGAYLNVATVSGVTAYTIYDKVGHDPSASDPVVGVSKATGSGTVDWTFVRSTFRITTAGVVRLYVQLGNGGTCPGVAYFDGVKLRRVVRPGIPLQKRIERVSETATQSVYKVKPWAPVTGVAGSITYDAGGLTVSPASGQAVTMTADPSTTGTVDFTITRPAQGGNPSRVAFTTTATGYVAATDSVDVQAQFDRFRCLLAKNTAQAISGSTWTAVTWQVETADNGGLHSTASNTSRITIPTNGNTGFWIFNAGALFTNPGGGGTAPTLIQLDLYKNGSTVMSMPIGRTYTNTAADALSLTKMISVPSVGDYFELYAHHDGSGGNWGLDQCFFEAIHVH